ncbi:M55 family metallopeptidase [Paenibacillus sacheonensis]|uniref:M55 family metallopeptidase n=1 Tax=Paenibacillus sacheonensis TaxID=742054 RepID=UPI00308444FE|nr:D-amino peptidase [Paenibacillus sacheonensis]
MNAYFILTDLEGAAGIDSFTQTRPGDGYPERVEEAKRLLAQEVNACMAGIRSADPDCRIDVWDGHGPGGLNEADLEDGRYLRTGEPYKSLAGYDALLFVGQHAMAGTYNAPLCHTYSSKTIAYMKLNETFIGEFGARALIAGLQGVPTVFISGDDKAILEAQLFVPGIEAVVVKRGQGREAAVHMDRKEACRLIREGAASAVRRRPDIEPLTAFASPYCLEIGYLQPLEADAIGSDPDVEYVNDRTVRMHRTDLLQLPL